MLEFMIQDGDSWVENWLAVGTGEEFAELREREERRERGAGEEKSGEKGFFGRHFGDRYWIMVWLGEWCW